MGRRSALLQAYLGTSVIIWAGFGILCLVRPSILGDMAGIAAGSATATIELRAMYGGLPLSMGVLAGVALANRAFVRPALVLFAYLCSGLFMARLIGALLALEVSPYTAAGLLFEILWAGFAVRLLDWQRR